jgi:flagellin
MSTLGGMRYLATSTVDGKTTQQWVPVNAYGSQANFEFNFSGPITFADPSDQMSFDVTVDKDNPADGIDPPYDPGKTTAITIDRSTVDAVNSSWNGKVSTFTQYEQVLNYALSQANASAYVGSVSDGKGGIVPNVIDFATKQDRSTGLNGSYVEVSNFTSSVASGGLSNNSDQGARGSALNLDFTSFQDFRDGDDADGLTVDFSFAVNNQPPKQYTFDRTYVNNVLGVDNGKIETSDQMVTVLRSLLSSDWPTLQIDASSVSSVTLKTDPALDRRAGSDTGIHFSNIDVSNEPIPTINFMDIDIDKNPDMVSDYLTYIEAASQRITSGAAQLGDIQKRIDQQTSFTQTLMDDIDSGVGKLTDADMEEESSKLAAQQTQQQLAVQALSIANSSPQTILSLFQQ